MIQPFTNLKSWSPNPKELALKINEIISEVNNMEPQKPAANIDYTAAQRSLDEFLSGMPVSEQFKIYKQWLQVRLNSVVKAQQNSV